MNKVHFLHWMTWPDMSDESLAANDGWAFLTYPNAEFDPVEGSALLRRWIDEMVFAEELGFDGLVYNEHHQWPHSHLPSANILSAALAMRTSRIKLVPLGHVLPLHHPVQLAEEIALVDLMSEGRVVAGLIKGIGSEFFTRSIDPGEARDRFYEAHDLLVQAWTRPGPFAFSGKFWHLPMVNIWPRPLQQPHPPIWIPGTGSPGTPAWAAQHGYPYVKGLDREDRTAAMFDIYRNAADEAGVDVGPDHLVYSKHAYIAETEAEAWARGTAHYEHVLHRLFKIPDHIFFPPGTVPEANYELAAKGYRRYYEASIRDLVDDGVILIGTPEQVTESLLESEEKLGFGQLVITLAFGLMGATETREHMSLFTERVMPHLRASAPTRPVKA